MSEFEHKRKPAQPGGSTEHTLPAEVTPEAGADIQRILHLQRTAGNQAVLRMLRARKAKSDALPPTAHSPRTGPTFSPSLIHPGLQQVHLMDRALQAAGQAPAFLPEGDGESLYAGQVQWKKHAQFPQVMGQTYYARMDIEQWPSYHATVERSLWPWGYKAIPKKTDAVGAVWPSVATPENEGGYKIPYEHPKHPGYEYYVRESGKAANIIAAAEQQHLNDLDEGWALTGVAVKNAINQTADEEPEVRGDPQAAKEAAVDKVVGKLGALGAAIRGALLGGGRLEDALGPPMDNAFRQSKARRDDSGKHTLGVRYVMKDDEKKRVLYEVNEDFNLDATSSADVVNYGTIL